MGPGGQESRDKSAETIQPEKAAGEDRKERKTVAGKRRQDDQNITGPDGCDRTTETGQSWQNSHDRTARTGHLGQAWTGRPDKSA
jgi:hypothetical protein